MFLGRNLTVQCRSQGGIAEKTIISQISGPRIITRVTLQHVVGRSGRRDRRGREGDPALASVSLAFRDWVCGAF